MYVESAYEDEEYFGIDVSVHNKDINVKQIRDAGYKRIIIRAGYGKNNVDQKFVSNAEACVNLSVLSGIYWFSYGYTEEMAANEANYAIAQAKKYWSKCPVAFDLEYDTVRYARQKSVEITKSIATEMAIAFLNVVVENGYIPVLYTNKDYAQRYFDIEEIEAALGTKLYIWYARYTNCLTTTEKEMAHIWQKSSKGKVPGIKGNVDINEFYTNFESTTVPTTSSKTCNINILNFQKAANLDGYTDQDGNKLKEDGLDGPKTQYVRKKIKLKAKKNLFTYKTGSTGHLVKYWQRRLTEMGFITEDDGKYGNNTRKNTMKMQEKYELVQDGVVGYNTMSMSFYN
ncbi:MAG: peptidoglycan-binding protein [Lachnospiraceae bacterium]|nr:peptidoglycan-binding protein [Lachnospiraceae bacterium]